MPSPREPALVRCLPLLLLPITARGATLQVGPTETYTTVSDALLAAADGDVIEVAAGDYPENLYIDKDVSIIGVAGSAATSLSAPSGTAVIVSGVTATLQGWTLNPTSNKGITASAGADFTGADLVVSGLQAYNDHGSGLLVAYSTATLTDCVFEDLSTWSNQDGGAIFINDSTVSLTRVQVSRAMTGLDGAVKLLRAQATVDDCTFEANDASGRGGALAVFDSTLILTQSRFVQNLSSENGGALFVSGSEVTAQGNTFCNNSSGRNGGAVATQNSRLLADQWTRNVFADNGAGGAGGALYLDTDIAVYLRNNTFVGNGSADGAHIRAESHGTDLINNVFAHGTAAGISQLDASGTRDYNLHWNEVPDKVGGGLAPTDLGNNSVFLDPMFSSWSNDADCDNDDFGLLEGSPAIDAGDPAFFDDDGSRADIGATHQSTPGQTGTTTTGTTATGTPTDPGTTGTQSDPGSEQPDPGNPSGTATACGCTTPRGPHLMGHWLLLVLLVGRTRLTGGRPGDTNGFAPNRTDSTVSRSDRDPYSPARPWMRFVPLMALWMGCGPTSPTSDSGPPTETESTPTSSTTSPGDCDPNPTDPTQFVVVGFWNNDPTCSGDPMITNSFPVSEEAGCYCWPGASGENSADSYACDPTAGSFTYTQYNSLTCGEGDDTPTEKTTYLDQCTQDIPQNLYSKIVDYGACGA